MATESTARDEVIVSVRLDREQHRAMAELAAKNDRTISGELRRAIRTYLIDSRKDSA